MNTVIIIIAALLAIFVIVAVVFLGKTNREAKAKGEIVEAKQKKIDPTCCGAHEVCDFELMKANPEMIEYFEDEELDSLKDINPDDYTDNQIDQLREVLYTLDSHEIRKWILSIDRRHILLPDFLQQEALDLMSAKD